jgi:hypothetical protein
MAVKINPTPQNKRVIAGYNGQGVLYPLGKGESTQTRYANAPNNIEALRKHRSIKNFLVELHDEECSGEILTAFRHYFPKIKRMTMREAWLRIVYMEAIAAHPWASMFIADRSEGKVGEGGIANDKGTILAAVEQMLENPITEETE